MTYSSRSYLLTYPSQIFHLKNDADSLTISSLEGKNSIGIEQIRELKEWIALKPFSKKIKIILISEARKMTVEAQNSLLKILEEPPPQTLIILSTANHKGLLPTIQSRSLLIKDLSLLPNYKEVQDRFLEKISKSEKKVPVFFDLIGKKPYPLADLFSLSESLAKKEKRDLLNALDLWSQEVKEKMLREQKKELAPFLKLIYQIRSKMEKNVNARTCLEYLFLKIGQNLQNPLP